MLIETLKNEFLYDCQIRELSPLTVYNYSKQLAAFIKFIDEECGITMLEELKPIHIKQYIGSIQARGCKPSYINDLLKAVKVMCRYAYNEGYTKDVITERVRNVKQPKVLIHTFSEAEIKRMINYFDGNDYLNMRNKMILMLFFDTGIRCAELMNMKLSQIQSNYFIIYGKGRKERVVPKSAVVSKFLMKYLSERERYFLWKDVDDYVFLSKNGKKLTEEAICKFMRDAGRAVHVNPMVRVSPHTCRHTFAHQQLKNGLDLYSLSRLLGHESVTITQRYLESIHNIEVLQSAKKTGVLSNLM